MFRLDDHELGEDGRNAVGRDARRSEALYPAHETARNEIRSHHELQAEGRRRPHSARRVRPRARGDEDVPRRRHHARARELHELWRHELDTRAGTSRQGARAQMGLRHRQPGVQSRPQQTEAVATPGPVGILGTRARPCRAHPHQGRNLEHGEERRRLQLARRRPGPRARHSQRRLRARLRQRDKHRTTHGRCLPRCRLKIQ